MPAKAFSHYLQRILTAKVYDVAQVTPLQHAPQLSRRIGNSVLLKREDMQPVFSFKLRGAYNKMAHLSAEQLSRGVICASAGNHAQGVALGAQRLGAHAVVVMPVTTPGVKVDAVKHLKGEVVLHGDSYSDAYAHAVELANAKGLTFVHPFDDPDVIAGQGTIAMELLQQVQALNQGHRGKPGADPDRLDAVFVAIGGGGLISGVAAYIKLVRPEVRVIGVQMTDSDAMLQSVNKGSRVSLDSVGLFADGTAVKQVGSETFKIAKALVDDYVRVSTDEVCAAVKDVFMETRTVLEPSGAMAVAAVKQYAAQHKTKGETYAAILCGANMNFDRLRFVAERAQVGEQREALFGVTIPEQRGSFLRFCQAIADLPGGPHSVTEFNYRISDSAEAHVFVGLSANGPQDSARVAKGFAKAGFNAIDLTHDELAKSHLRHLVGGRTSLAQEERLLRFEFPERPGALLRFLNAMQPSWNISLFHYRNQGADYGRILVGVQVPQADHKAFKAFLTQLGYPYIDETDNPAYRMFLR
jgi:threonine dehydratase